MKKMFAIVLLAILTHLSWAKKADVPATESKVVAVSDFNIESYMGLWYEIARMPTYFARRCQAPITAYFKREENTIVVANSCATVSGESQVNSSIIYLNESNIAGDGRLVGSSMPSWLRWLPFLRNDYWIIYIDKNYALIATPDHQHLWLLARTESPALEDVERILSLAKNEGFDLKKIIFNYPFYYVD